MKNYSTLFFSFLTVLLLINCSPGTTEVDYNTDKFQVIINDKAVISKLIDKSSLTNYIVENKPSYLLSVKIGDSIIHPDKADFSDNREQISLTFPESLYINIKVVQKKSHITLEVDSISNEKNIDAIVWGPYNITINKSIGETIGIVQNDDFTIGIQALNLKTLGGYPWNDNDHLPQLDIFRQSDYNNMVKEKGNAGVLYSVEAAKPTEYGSSIQAYTRNRNENRVIKNKRHDRYLAPEYDDGGLTGSKIALFGSSTDATLTTIGKIEVEENLPHPMIDGQWIKTSPIINSSYMIMSFTEETIDECITYTKKAGFNYLYHGHPFASWGHFPLIKEQFPNGYEGMKTCVEKAEKQGIRLGTHMLTNFINTKDAYVTPVPDKRLAIVGSSKSVNDITASQTEIEIESPDFFNQFSNNNLKSVVIDDEIIRYGSVSQQAPWLLKDCIRGAFGSKSSAHLKQTKISKLSDHSYKVFLGNFELNKEIAENMADFMNATGVRMLDFDGLEGAGGSTASGNYGEVLFADAWHNRLNENLKKHFVLGASRPGHYFWHIYSRMNWGEPWYAGFRESQTAYRLENQKYFKRNLMPGMLGWFKMTSNTTLEDIEWLMTRSAAYNAGFAFVMDKESLKENAKTEEILALLNTWETARLKGLFTKELQAQMLDLSTEFHLEKGENNTLVLNQVYSHKFSHAKKVRQPGEPLYSTFNFENNTHEQIVNFIITAEHTNISKIEIELDQHKNITLPVVLKNGQSIKYMGGEKVVVYDKTWDIIKEIPIDSSLLKLAPGNHTITFDCGFNNSRDDAKAKVEFRLKGKEENIL